MELIVNNNRQHRRQKGFSLIEMMIALFILTVAVLGLLDLTITSIRTNMQNDIRNTTVRLTTQMAEILLAQPSATSQALSMAQCQPLPGIPCSLTNYSGTNAALADPAGTNPNYFQYYPNPAQRIRGGAQTYTYTVTWTVSDLTGDLKEISIAVSYTYRGQIYTNSAVIHKHKAV